MKKIFMFLALISLTGCSMWGYRSRENELIGQVKKVVHRTPMVCSEFDSADISLGVLRNGVGSMSSQDVWVTVFSSDDLKILKKANETGQLVKIKYDERRATYCIEDFIVKSVELVK